MNIANKVTLAEYPKKTTELFLLATPFLCPLFSRQGLLREVTKLVITLPRKVDRVTKLLPTCHRRVREVEHGTDTLAKVSEATVSIVGVNYVKVR